MPVDRTKAYTEAGVDIAAGNALVERIKKIVAGTQTRGVVSDIGGFGGLFRPDAEKRRLRSICGKCRAYRRSDAADVRPVGRRPF